MHWEEEKLRRDRETVSKLRSELVAISQQFSVPPHLHLDGQIMGRIEIRRDFVPYVISESSQQQRRRQLYGKERVPKNDSKGICRLVV